MTYERINQIESSGPDEVLSLICGILGGAISGILLGILFAPRPGKETQECMQGQLQNLVNRLPDPATEDARSGAGNARSLFLKTRANIETQVERVSRSLQSSKLAKAKIREAQSNEIYSENSFLDN